MELIIRKQIAAVKFLSKQESQNIKACSLFLLTWIHTLYSVADIITWVITKVAIESYTVFLIIYTVNVIC